MGNKNIAILKTKITEARELLRAYTSVREYEQIILPIIFLCQSQYIFDKSPRDFPEKARFSFLFEKRHNKRFNHILIEAFLSLENENNDLHEVFYTIIFLLRSNEWINKPILAEIFEIFSDIPECITFINSDTSFEEDVFLNAIQTISEQNKHSDSYFTPINLSATLAHILSPVGGDRIYDPACGSGTLLLACAKEASKKSPTSCYLTGVEKNSQAWTIAKINLFLHNFRNTNILQSDALREYGPREQFDIVVSCPPWSVKNWGHENFFQRLNRINLYFDFPPKSSADYAFILEIVDKLSDTGRGGVILPTGALSRSGVEMRIRKELLSMNCIEAVISLPEKMFFNTNIAASILLFNMKRHTQEVFFIDAKEKNNFDAIVTTYKDKIEIDNYSRFVDQDEIASHNYDLGILNYLQPPAHNMKICDPQALRRDRVKLSSQLEDVNFTIDKNIQHIIKNLDL